MMRVDAINERIRTLKTEEAEHAAVIADLEIRKENALTILHNDLDAFASISLIAVKPAIKPLYSATLFVATPMKSYNSATIFPFSVMVL